MLGTSRIVASFLASVLVISPALAQPKDKGANAQELVKKAIAASKSGDHLGAIDLYLEAYKLAPVPVLLSNIGTEYKQAEKPVEALKYFCKYLDAEPTGNSSTYATAQAKLLVRQLTDKDVDDQSVCKVKPEREGRTKEREPKEREPKEREPKEREPKDTKIKIGTTDGGGDDGARTRKPTRTGNVDDLPPTDDTRHDTPDDPGALYKNVGLGGMLAGAAMLGIGFYYGYKAGQISDKITNHNPNDPWPDTIKSDEAEGQAAENRQVGFLIAGTLVAGAGVAVFFYGRTKTPAEHVTLRPVLTPTTAGFALGGRF